MSTQYIQTKTLGRVSAALLVLAVPAGLAAPVLAREGQLYPALVAASVASAAVLFAGLMLKFALDRRAIHSDSGRAVRTLASRIRPYLNRECVAVAMVVLATAVSFILGVVGTLRWHSVPVGFLFATVGFCGLGLQVAFGVAGDAR